MRNYSKTKVELFEENEMLNYRIRWMARFFDCEIFCFPDGECFYPLTDEE